MINIGNRRPLEQEDLWAMVSGDRCSTVLAAYQASKTTTKSIYRRILKVVGGLVALQCFMGVVTVRIHYLFLTYEYRRSSHSLVHFSLTESFSTFNQVLQPELGSTYSDFLLALYLKP